MHRLSTLLDLEHQVYEGGSLRFSWRARQGFAWPHPSGQGCLMGMALESPREEEERRRWLRRLVLLNALQKTPPLLAVAWEEAWKRYTLMLEAPAFWSRRRLGQALNQLEAIMSFFETQLFSEASAQAPGEGSVARPLAIQNEKLQWIRG